LGDTRRHRGRWARAGVRADRSERSGAHDTGGGLAMSDLLAWVDGELVAADQATVSVHDRGFRGGEGVFETIRAYGGHPFRLTAHVERAVRGAAELGFEVASRDLTDAVASTATANLQAFDGEDSVVRLTVSAGRIDPDSPFPG